MVQKIKGEKNLDGEFSKTPISARDILRIVCVMSQISLQKRIGSHSKYFAFQKVKFASIWTSGNLDK